MDDRADLNRPPELQTFERPVGTATRVRFQVFPLAADPQRLQLLCDEYFNAYVPASVAHFRVALPVVFCSVLHYPEMGGEVPWRTGTLSQNEIYFLVILERHRRVEGRWEFVEYAAFTPYILVDSTESAVAGRERFGMPKQNAVFTGRSVEVPWPTDPQTHLSVSAFNPSLSGHRLDPLLEVIRLPEWTPNVRLSDGDGIGTMPKPPDPGVGSLLWFARALARSVDMGRPPEAWLRTIAELWQVLHWRGDVPLYNLRQFGDPEFENAARYQDLVCFRAKVADVQDGGFIRAPTRLRLHRTAVRPIAERLGLRVTDREVTTTPDGEGSVDILESLGAFYTQLDIDLLDSSRKCWRGGDTGWFADGEQITEPVPGMRAAYNRHLGPSSAAYFEERGERSILDFKFLMLPAHRDCVAKLIAERIPDGAPISIEPCAVGNVCAIRLAFYRSRPPLAQEQEDLKWLDGSYASISVPVHLDALGGSGTALFLLRDFTSNDFMVQALREVALAPTSFATFSSDVGGWFSSTQPVARVATVTTPMLERTATAARVYPQPLLDVFSIARETGIEDLPRGIEEGELREVVDELWPRVAGIFPLVSVGAIECPSAKDKLIARRVLLTLFDQVEVATPHTESISAVQHVVRAHDTESFPLWHRLGLRDLPQGSRLGDELRHGTVGRTWIVPSVAYGEAAYRIDLSHFRVAWEQFRQ